MKISLIMSLYNERKIIENTLDSILGDSKYECDVHINLSGPRFIEENIECLQGIQNKDKNYKLFLHVYGEEVRNHLTVAMEDLLYQSYYKMNYDVVAAGSPDFILCDKNAFNDFIDQSQEHMEDRYSISCIEHEGSTVRSAFQIITKKRLDEVGYHDPNFAPMGNSDSDMHRRCLLKFNPGQDLEYYNSPENDINSPYGVDLVIPSSHLSYTEHGTLGIDYTNFIYKDAFDLNNRNYYNQKWGGSASCEPGLPGAEVFLRPFDDEEIPIRISHEQMRNGYSKYDRKDLTLATII